ncbi:M1 family peptidase [Streptomyces asoensis]|uniref:M1 family peptidase n=1 Tax=Streptomyces asoensis TaxID=249586 RepID=UPI00372014D6
MSLPAAWSSGSRRRLFVVLLVLLVAFAAGVSDADAQRASTASKSAATPDRARYDVTLRADADGGHWTGRQRVSLRNASARPLREVYLRLWGNGEDGCGTPGAPLPPVTVTHVEGGTPGPLSVDCTALRISLPRPLARGARTSVAFDVSLTVPGRNARFGREGAFRFLGNALPVLAVHDAEGWHLDPYVALGESFYALTSDFRVRLDHPSALKVPATGLTRTRPGRPGRTVTLSVADRVRDFAWAAGPFRTAAQTTPGGVRVRSYWAPGTSAEGVRLNRTDAVAAVDRFGREFGRYPYGELDLVMTLTAVPGPVRHGRGQRCVVVGPGDVRPAVAGLPAVEAGVGRTGRSSRPATVRRTRTTSSTRPAPAPSPTWNAPSAPPPWPASLSGTPTSTGTGVSTTADFKKAAQAMTDVDLTPFWKAHRIR